MSESVTVAVTVMGCVEVVTAGAVNVADHVLLERVTADSVPSVVDKLTPRVALSSSTSDTSPWMVVTDSPSTVDSSVVNEMVGGTAIVNDTVAVADAPRLSVAVARTRRFCTVGTAGAVNVVVLPVVGDTVPSSNASHVTVTVWPDSGAVVVAVIDTVPFADMA